VGEKAGKGKKRKRKSLSFQLWTKMQKRTEVDQLVDRIQMETTITHFNRIADSCFRECIIDFKSDLLLQAEEVCVARCVDKFTQFDARLQREFVELQRSGMKQK